MLFLAFLQPMKIDSSKLLPRGGHQSTAGGMAKGHRPGGLILEHIYRKAFSCSGIAKRPILLVLFF